MNNTELIKKYKEVFFDNNDLEYLNAKKMLNEARADQDRISRVDERAKFEEAIIDYSELPKDKRMELLKNPDTLLRMTIGNFVKVLNYTANDERAKIVEELKTKLNTIKKGDTIIDAEFNAMKAGYLLAIQNIKAMG